MTKPTREKVKEKDLFLPLKKEFKARGYKVYPEVPFAYRSVDFVAVKPNEHIAVEMKLSLTKKVVYQANMARSYFHKVYVAIGSKPRVNGDNFTWCVNNGIGILRVMPIGTIFEMVVAVRETPNEIYDFSTGFSENDNDEAGVPHQKGVSMAFVVLRRIKDFVKKHPDTNWKEIYNNVQSHYAHAKSMSGSMGQFKGFHLEEFKDNL